VESDKTNPLLTGRAYPLFKEEIKAQIAEFDRALFFSEVNELTKRREFSIIFHKIKGSSGFFGFQDIYALAGMLEDLLNKVDFKKNPDWHSVVDLFEQLKKECEKLPEL
jgi:HPt (histidine-containing phosphotransfer) domain-containing protein